MELHRREVAALLPLLFAQTAKTQANALPTKAFRHEDLPVSKSPNGNASLRIFNGATHMGDTVELHETQLAPGNMPHAAHSHEHVEILLIREGILEVTIDGVATKLGPGSVAYLASNALHGWKNVGSTHAFYFVMALGRKT